MSRHPLTGAEEIEVSDSILTTKGDIHGRDATGDARLAVGTTGRVLMADSSAALGIKWSPDVVNPLGKLDGQTIAGDTVQAPGTYTGTKGMLWLRPWADAEAHLVLLDNSAYGPTADGAELFLASDAAETHWIDLAVDSAGASSVSCSGDLYLTGGNDLHLNAGAGDVLIDTLAGTGTVIVAADNTGKVAPAVPIAITSTNTLILGVDAVGAAGNGGKAIVWGNGATVNGEDATNGSIAIGDNASVSINGGNAIGRDAESLDAGGFALGDGTIAGKFCTAIGSSALAGSGNNVVSSVAIGQGARAGTADYGAETEAMIAIGAGAHAEGMGAIAIGRVAEATAHECVIGSDAHANYRVNSFRVVGQDGDVLRAHNTPVAGGVGIDTWADVGAGAVQKSIKCAASPPGGSMLLYVDP